MKEDTGKKNKKKDTGKKIKREHCRYKRKQNKIKQGTAWMIEEKKKKSRKEKLNKLLYEKN